MKEKETYTEEIPKWIDKILPKTKEKFLKSMYKDDKWYNYGNLVYEKRNSKYVLIGYIRQIIKI